MFRAAIGLLAAALLHFLSSGGNASARSDHGARPRVTHWNGPVIRVQSSVLVEKGDTLRIDAGTRVEFGPGAGIVVMRGGALMADGTPTMPVTFQCAGPAVPGCWEGIRINGRAPINHGTLESGCHEAVLEGATYGGCDAGSGSGALRYVVIRHASTGLQLRAVGLGTVIDHVSVQHSLSHGVVALGGYAQMRYLYLASNGGTALRYEGGWTGNAQFILIAQDPTKNQGGVTGTLAPGSTGAPSFPRLFNVTVWNPVAPANPDQNAAALRFQGGATGTLGNWLLLEAGTGLDIDDAATCQALANQALALSHVIVATTASFGASDADPVECGPNPNAELALLQSGAGNLLIGNASQVAAVVRASGLAFADYRPSSSSPANAIGAQPLNDGFFDTTVRYYGAVEPATTSNNNIPWYAGWSGVNATLADVIPPGLQLTSPAHQSLNLSGAISLSATASDNVGVFGVTFQVDGQSAGPEDTSPPYQFTLPATSAYAHGIHVVRARARDAAGNLSAWSAATVTFDGPQTLPAGFTVAPYGAPLPDLATDLDFAPDGRLFVTLKSGTIRIIDSGGTLLPGNFASLNVDSNGEQGLLGITFDPGFATNGFIYVHYSTNVLPPSARVSRITASGNTMIPGSEVAIFEVPNSSNSFHEGGGLHFGVDGKLYLAVGDNGNGSNAQSLDNPFGKILRFNSNGTIPADNPFLASTSGPNRAIWAIGLRNPFTFAIHPTSGRMLINDVGEHSWEEINEGAAGRNFGWPTTEGATSNPAFTTPVFTYPRFGSFVAGASIVGASFYAPPIQLFPASYSGNYFFADYISGWVHRLDPANDNAVYAFAWMGANITNLRVGPDGALYVLIGSPAPVQRISFTP